MKRTLTAIFLIAFYIGSTNAQEENIYTLKTDANLLKTYKTDGYDIIDLLDSDSQNEIVGTPMLPIKKVNIAIPNNCTISDIKIINIEEREIAGEYNILPVLQPVISSLGNDDSVFINEKIYNSNTDYPAKIIEYVDDGILAGTKIAILNYFPVKYNPISKKIKIIIDITFQVSLNVTSFSKESSNVILNPHSFDFLTNHIKDKIINPVFLNQKSSISSNTKQHQAANSQNPKIDYIIITKDSLSGGFAEIADWKIKKGLYSKVVTTEWINDQFSGSDLPEKIRTFIKYAFENWGTLWFLIGGDTDIVPIREVWISHFNNRQLTTYRANGEFIPTDMYYACLDGTWNKDGDLTFGEADWNRSNNGILSYISSDANIDDVDRTPDVFVGRIPVKNNQQLSFYKAKYFKYLKGENVYPNKALVFSANSDAIYSSEMNIVASRFPSNKVIVDKLYECIGNYNSNCGTKSDVYNSLTEGQYQIACGYGHGGATDFGACNDNISKVEISNLQNTINKGTILYNNHCETMAWDKDCIGEEYLIVSNGGVAYIGNTRYGWTGDPTRYNHKFISNLYARKHIGEALYDAKGSGSTIDGVSRWGFFALNLSADPEMQIWTNTPQTMNVALNATSMPCGENTVAVTITGIQNADEEVRICLYKKDEVFEPLTVFGNDTYTFTGIHPLTPGDLYVTVTAHNYIPDEKIITVTTNPNQHVYFLDMIIDDDKSGASNGNNDGQIDAGETIELTLQLKNNGLTQASNVIASISCSSPYVNLQTSQANYGNIPAGQTKASLSKYVLTIDKDAPELLKSDPDAIVFELNISDGNGNSFTNTFGIDVFNPILKIGNKTINGGNNIAAGQTVNFYIDLQNIGKAQATGLSAVLSSTSPYVQSCSAIPRLYPAVARNEVKQNISAFQFQTTGNYPTSGALNFNLRVENEFGRVWNLPFNLTERPAKVSEIDFTADVTEINLFWTPIQEVAGYNIYRCAVDENDSETGNYIKLNNDVIPFIYYDDLGLDHLTKYYYKVAAVSVTGNEGMLSEPFMAWTSLPVKKHHYDFGSVRGGITTADINNDGKKEIFAATRSGTDGAHLLGIDCNGMELFNIDGNITTLGAFGKMNGVSFGTPAVSEMAADGTCKIYGTTRDYSPFRLYCFSNKDDNNDHKPDLLKTRDLPSGNITGAILSNLDNSPDGSMETVVVCENGHIVLFNSDLDLINTIHQNNNRSYYGAIAVADIDNNGGKEIIKASDDGIYIWKDDATAYKGISPFYNFSVTSPYPSVIVCDIDNDGKKEVITACNNKVYAIRTDVPNKMVAGWNQPYLSTSEGAFSVGDLNQDGNLEIVVLGTNQLTVLDNKGNILSSLNISNLSPAGAPIIADVDGDSDNEIIFNSTSGLNKNVYAFKMNFDTMELTKTLGFPLKIDETAYCTPAVSDIDGDGKNEIILGVDTWIYIWKTNGIAGNVEWGAIRGNQHNTGEYIKPCHSVNITSNQMWSSNRNVCGNLTLYSGKLTINNNAGILMGETSTITIMQGTTLEIDEANLFNADVRVLSGGTLIMKNNGSIKLRQGGEFIIDSGGIYENTSGSIDIP